MAMSHFRAVGTLGRSLRVSQRAFTVSARQLENTLPTAKSETSPVSPETKSGNLPQAPNRTEVWSRHQRPRTQAMTGPRFEQTDFNLQPQSLSAMEMIHKEPVRWTHERVVECNGGGGAKGHPKIFINTDKPEIAVCGYCGLPYANEHNRKHLESLPETSYPLS